MNSTPVTYLVNGALAGAERLAEIGRLGARQAIQRAVEEEVDAFLGRTRHERTPEARACRNGNRPRQAQAAGDELEIQVPQIRGAAEKFVSTVIPNGRTALRTRPLEALIIGVCGSTRTIAGPVPSRTSLRTARARPAPARPAGHDPDP